MCNCNDTVAPYSLHPNTVVGVKNKSDNETSIEANDSASLFIDICYIFIVNERSCPFQ
jgi:hypothetical protein